MPLDANAVFAGTVQLLILLFAVSAHEAAHAWSAARRGDCTAAELGRVSLNPLRHLDFFGSLIVPVLLLVTGSPVFGWARPTPVRPGRMGNPQRDHLAVTLAGPAANVLLAAGAVAALVAAVAALGPEASRTAYLSLVRRSAEAAGGAHFPLLYTLVQLSVLNGFLAIFNLLPIPPLDGGELLVHLLPPDWAVRVSALRPYGFMIVLVLAALNVLAVIVLPVYVVVAVAIQLASS